MLKYINKQEYLELSGNESIPDNFNRLVIEASSYINLHTFERIDSYNVCEEVKFTTASIVDLISESTIKKQNIGNLKAENVEGWSQTYITVEEIDSKLEIDKKQVLVTYLTDITGRDGNKLLYRGA